MQAQGGEMDLIAKNDFRITSVDGKLTLQAPKEILMMAGGGYIRIGADIEIHNPGSQSQKAAAFTLAGPDSLAPAAAVPNNDLKPCKLKLAAAAESGAVGVPR
jgi:type VI secretion system secreted protein VgrG